MFGLRKPFDEGHLYWYFSRAQKKASLSQHYRFHDLRHTFASHFVMNGGSLYDLQKLLGHARFEETQRYAHLSPGHLAKAINIVSFGGPNIPAPSNAASPTPLVPAAVVAAPVAAPAAAPVAVTTPAPAPAVVPAAEVAPSAPEAVVTAPPPPAAPTTLLGAEPTKPAVVEASKTEEAKKDAT